MKLEVLENGLKIIPENYQDQAFLELKLGLKKDGEIIFFTRVNDVNENGRECFFLFGHDYKAQNEYNSKLIKDYLNA